MPRAPKKCGRADCTTRVVGRTYCDLHTAEQQARANTTKRGYGSQHQKMRAQHVAAFRPGQLCTRCGEPIATADQADLGHTDDRTGYLGLEHKTCNRRAGAMSKARPGC